MSKILRVALVSYIIRYILYIRSMAINIAFISRTLGLILEVQLKLFSTIPGYNDILYITIYKP